MAAYTDGLDEARTAIHREKEKFYLPLDEGEEMAYCCLERHRGEKVTAFHLHREDTGAFILARVRRVDTCSCDSTMEGEFKFHTLTDSHLRTMAAIPESADSAVYLGSMEINFLGTEFVVRDHRGNHTPTMMFSHELGLTVYESNVSGRSPNSMKVVVPRLHANQITEENSPDASLSDRYAKVAKTKFRGSRFKRWFPRTANFVARRRSFGDENGPPLRIAASTPTAGGTIQRSFSNIKNADKDEDGDVQEYCALEGDEMMDMQIFHTKKPVWNDELHAWTLNFNGRAKRASKKNFLLTPPVDLKEGTSTKDDGRVFLRFGKMSKSRFSLDFRDPFSPLVALGVAVTTFAKKRAVT